MMFLQGKLYAKDIKREIQIQTQEPLRKFRLCSRNTTLTLPLPRGINTWAFESGPWFTIGDPLKDMILKQKIRETYLFLGSNAPLQSRTTTKREMLSSGVLRRGATRLIQHKAGPTLRRRKRSFISIRPTVHSNPSRKQSVSKRCSNRRYLKTSALSFHLSTDPK